MATPTPPVGAMAVGTALVHSVIKGLEVAHARFPMDSDQAKTIYQVREKLIKAFGQGGGTMDNPALAKILQRSLQGPQRGAMPPGGGPPGAGPLPQPRPGPIPAMRPV
jgi:hypothetical protein